MSYAACSASIGTTYNSLRVAAPRLESGDFHFDSRHPESIRTIGRPTLSGSMRWGGLRDQFRLILLDLCNGMATIHARITGWRVLRMYSTSTTQSLPKAFE